MHQNSDKKPHKIWLLTLGGVFLGWLALLSTVMVLSDEASGAIVLFPAETFTHNLPEGAAITDIGRHWIAIRADDTPDLGLALYRAGGRLVLPAGLVGCLPFPAS